MKLEIGYKSNFEVRKEVILLENAPNFSILYLSDLHLNRFSQRLMDNIKNCIEMQNPDIILLGGDYADTQRGFFYFDQFLQFLSQRKNVFAIAGNHDYFWGMEKIKNACEKYKISWLENQFKTLTINHLKINIVGTKPQNSSNNADFNILCLHEPIDIRPFHDQFDLVFAGHLHGCQVVFWETEKGLFPGKFFYKWNILKTQIGNCIYLISKGLGDTLPIRFNCMREVILVKCTAKLQLGTEKEPYQCS
jgi:predicted MPP superfamily phosphohydrolase